MFDLNKFILVEVCDKLCVKDVIFVELIEVCLFVIEGSKVLNVFVYNMLEIVME